MNDRPQVAKSKLQDNQTIRVAAGGVAGGAATVRRTRQPPAHRRSNSRRRVMPDGKVMLEGTSRRRSGPGKRATTGTDRTSAGNGHHCRHHPRGAHVAMRRRRSGFNQRARAMRRRHPIRAATTPARRALARDNVTPVATTEAEAVAISSPSAVPEPQPGRRAIAAMDHQVSGKPRHRAPMVGAARSARRVRQRGSCVSSRLVGLAKSARI